jgi:NAD(P)-dependent dehydrogenase (short-subunit alcohol dehydrogenase family)
MAAPSAGDERPWHFVVITGKEMLAAIPGFHSFSRFAPNASIVLFGGLAKERPYPGSTTVTSVNGAVTSMVRTLATELAPMRVNAVHPGIVGDSPYWAGKSEALARTIARTPIGRLATMQEVAHATLFLLDNGAVNGST